MKNTRLFDSGKISEQEFIRRAMSLPNRDPDDRHFKILFNPSNTKQPRKPILQYRTQNKAYAGSTK